MTWSTIKNFGRIKYFNISYAVIILVPILANSFNIINDKLSCDLVVPATIKALYFASLLYAVAIAIYQYRCPAIIKDYLNVQDYLEKNQKLFENKAPDLKFYIVLAQLDQATQIDTYNEILRLHKKISETLSEIDKTQIKAELDKKLNLVYSSCIQMHLQILFTTENKREAISYWIAGFLYSVATLIIIYLLLIKTIVVFNT